MELTVQSSEVLEAYEPDEGIGLGPPVSGEELMVVRVDIAPGATLRIHDHPHEQPGYVVDGPSTFTGEDRREVGAGDGYYVPSGHGHSVEGHDEPAVAIDAFAPAREDYYELALVHPEAQNTQPPVYRGDYSDMFDAIDGGRDGSRPGWSRPRRGVRLGLRRREPDRKRPRPRVR